ncbi:hypothetical protein ACJX0J_036905 [Zea mays]
MIGEMHIYSHDWDMHEKLHTYSHEKLNMIGEMHIYCHEKLNMIGEMHIYSHDWGNKLDMHIYSQAIFGVSFKLWSVSFKLNVILFPHSIVSFACIQVVSVYVSPIKLFLLMHLFNQHVVFYFLAFAGGEANLVE